MKKFKLAVAIIIGLISNVAFSQQSNNKLLNVPFVNYSTSVHAVEEESFSSPAQSPSLALLALNPGYAIDGVQNVGEFIQLTKLTPGPLPLAGYALRYTNKSGNKSDLFIFPEGSQMVGNTLTLRLASSPEASQADLTYTKTLALDAGPLELIYQEEVIDSVCWTGKDNCLQKFLNKDGSRTTIVQDLGTKVFAHESDYIPAYDPETPNYLPPPSAPTEEDSDPIEPHGRGLEFTEILTYYDSDKSDQFIELYNTTDESMNLAGCSIKYKTKTLPLSGTLESSAYLAYHPDITLTKNPSSSNSYEIIDTTGDVLDTLILPHGQKKSTSYAEFGRTEAGSKNWLTTYSPTPGEANNFQQYRSCPEGKIINEETGNCVKAASISEIKECPAGKYRNPLTGRCKSLEEDSDVAPCKEGYERNPETNRCRKIRNNDGTTYPLLPQTAAEKSTFIAGIAIAAVLLVGAIYIILQYRPEISRFVKKHLHLLKPHEHKHILNKKTKQ